MEAAQVFEAESATPPGVDLGAITDRMEIRKAVQSGNMEEAIERVNDLNPQVSSSINVSCLWGQSLSLLVFARRDKRSRGRRTRVPALRQLLPWRRCQS